MTAVRQLYHSAAVLRAVCAAGTALFHALACPAQQGSEEARAAGQHNAVSAVQITICRPYVNVDQLLGPPEPG